MYEVMIEKLTVICEELRQVNAKLRVTNAHLKNLNIPEYGFREPRPPTDEMHRLQEVCDKQHEQIMNLSDELVKLRGENDYLRRQLADRNSVHYQVSARDKNGNDWVLQVMDIESGPGLVRLLCNAPAPWGVKE